MAIQMRRGQLANYDKSKMLAGEWGISIDNDSDNQKAFISFAPGVSKEVMMVEDAEEQIAVATAEAIDMATEEAEAWAHGNSFHVNDYASGDGSTKSFMLAETPSSILGVYVDGSSVSAYTLSGKTITFTTAPASGSNNIRVYYTVNTTTDNAKYYLEQAEAVAESIPEDYSELSDDVDQLKNALTTKAEQDGAYPDLTAGQILSKVESADSVPYNFRGVEQNATLEYTDAIVGGSVVWNQLAKEFSSENWLSESGVSASYADGVATISTTTAGNGILSPVTTIENNHVYYIGITAKCSAAIDLRFGVGSLVLTDDTFPKASFSRTEGIKKAQATASNRIALYGKNTTYTDLMTKDAELIDLTQMFGTAIADFLYSLGSEVGVAWLKKRFPKMFTYQPYNAGEIVSVQGLSEHVTVGFNQWDEEWEVGDINASTGGDWATDDRIRSKNYIPVIPGMTYYLKAPANVNVFAFYDANKNFLSSLTSISANYVRTVPDNAWFIKFGMSTNYGTTYNHDICINISCDRNGEYEPYVKRTYPLDSTKTFRGIFKLDSNNNLYADGDRYLPDGTVQRRYGVVDLGTLDWTYNSTNQRWYGETGNALYTNYRFAGFITEKYASDTTGAAGDNNKIMMTVGAFYLYSTDSATKPSGMCVYPLATTTTETAEPYTNPQIVDPDGTEEYVSTSIVPVGHESRYPLDIAGRLDKILTMPTANGTYTLKATVNNGAVTYAWVST